jgi:hypothetical protein
MVSPSTTLSTIPDWAVACTLVAVFADSVRKSAGSTHLKLADFKKFRLEKS